MSAAPLARLLRTIAAHIALAIGGLGLALAGVALATDVASLRAFSAGRLPMPLALAVVAIRDAMPGDLAHRLEAVVGGVGLAALAASSATAAVGVSRWRPASPALRRLRALPALLLLALALLLGIAGIRIGGM